jgi:hypothetical protein
MRDESAQKIHLYEVCRSTFRHNSYIKDRRTSYKRYLFLKYALSLFLPRLPHPFKQCH